MQWVARIDVSLPCNVIERAPTFWEKIQALAGASIDLGTDRVRDRMEAGTIVYELRRALDALGIDNARSLTIDGAVVFNDEKGEPGDLPALVVAFLDYTSMFGDSFEELRLSVEHEEAGLHFEVEGVVTSEHRLREPSTRITVLGRLLGPEKEFAGTPLEAKRILFGAFASRVEEALRGRFPEGTVTMAFEEIRFAEVARKVEPSNLAISPTAPTERASTETASPQRNFTLTLEQRIAAAVVGAPPYAVRARKIEDLEAELIGEIAQIDVTTPLPLKIARGIDRLNALIVDHNRYYPIECNLPVDVVSGRLLSLRGEPWQPLPLATAESLRARAQATGPVG
jgi:hypothetical protein